MMLKSLQCHKIEIHSSQSKNSKSPYNPNKPLKIRVPNRKISSIYKVGLRGGYAFVNANYCEFRHLEVDQTNSVPENVIKQVSFEDVNGLYMSLLKQRISIGNYVFYSRRHNKKQFNIIAKNLCSMNIERVTFEEPYVLFHCHPIC